MEAQGASVGLPLAIVGMPRGVVVSHIRKLPQNAGLQAPSKDTQDGINGVSPAAPAFAFELFGDEGKIKPVSLRPLAEAIPREGVDAFVLLVWHSIAEAP